MPNFLLIDDDDVIQFVHKNILAKTHPDAHVTAVYSGAEAKAFMMECSDEDWPEMVFLDINMPIQSGFEFLDELEERHPDLHAKLAAQSRLVLLTSSVNPKDVAAAETRGVIERILSKPLNIKKVAELEQP